MSEDAANTPNTHISILQPFITREEIINIERRNAPITQLEYVRKISNAS